MVNKIKFVTNVMSLDTYIKPLPLTFSEKVFIRIESYFIEKKSKIMSVLHYYE